MDDVFEKGVSSCCPTFGNEKEFRDFGCGAVEDCDSKRFGVVSSHLIGVVATFVVRGFLLSFEVLHVITVSTRSFGLYPTAFST